MEQVFLFLDIDGVINTGVNSQAKLIGSHQGKPLYGCPSIFVKSFLHAIDQSNHIKPFWLSSGWRDYSNVWNQWADIAPWSIAYPISFEKTMYVIKRYQQQLSLDDLDDGKTIAALYHAEVAPKIVWIEDGFLESAIHWATLDSRVTLINAIHASDPSLIGIQDWNVELISRALSIRFIES